MELTCSMCDGIGAVPKEDWSPERCPDCNGEGKVMSEMDIFLEDGLAEVVQEKRELPKALTDQERLELLHKTWKNKQDAVPESPEDMFIFRDNEDKFEIKLTRKQFEDCDLYAPDIERVLINVVKVSVGEAEKSAK